MAEPKFKWRTRDWYPLRLGEAIFRIEDGGALLWAVDENTTEASNKLMATAKSYASRLGITVKCKVGKLVIEDENGVEIVRRVVELRPEGNEKAAEFARLVREGDPVPEPTEVSVDAATAFVEKPQKPKGRRGRPPVIKTEADRKKWEAEFARRDAEQAGSTGKK